MKKALKILITTFLFILAIGMVSAVECGSDVNAGAGNCDVTVDTTFNGGHYKARDIHIVGNNITLTLNGTTLDYDETWTSNADYVRNMDGTGNSIQCINEALIYTGGWGNSDGLNSDYHSKGFVDYSGGSDGLDVDGCHFETRAYLGQTRGFALQIENSPNSVITNNEFVYSNPLLGSSGMVFDSNYVEGWRDPFFLGTTDWAGYQFEGDFTNNEVRVSYFYFMDVGNLNMSGNSFHQEPEGGGGTLDFNDPQSGSPKTYNIYDNKFFERHSQFPRMRVRDYINKGTNTVNYCVGGVCNYGALNYFEFDVFTPYGMKNTCVTPTSSMTVSTDTNFCEGTYTGIHSITVNAGVTLDMTGVTFDGQGTLNPIFLSVGTGVRMFGGHIFGYDAEMNILADNLEFYNVAFKNDYHHPMRLGGDNLIVQYSELQSLSADWNDYIEFRGNNVDIGNNFLFCANPTVGSCGIAISNPPNDWSGNFHDNCITGQTAQDSYTGGVWIYNNIFGGVNNNLGSSVRGDCVLYDDANVYTNLYVNEGGSGTGEVRVFRNEFLDLQTNQREIYDATNYPTYKVDWCDYSYDDIRGNSGTFGFVGTSTDPDEGTCPCVNLVSNTTYNSDTYLCRGTHNVESVTLGANVILECDGATISGSGFESSGQTGIIPNGHNITIRNCDIRDYSYIDPVTPYAGGTASAMRVTSNSQYLTVENSNFENNAYDFGHYGGVGFLNGLTLRNNRFDRSAFVNDPTYAESGNDYGGVWILNPTYYDYEPYNVLEGNTWTWDSGGLNTGQTTGKGHIQINDNFFGSRVSLRRCSNNSLFVDNYVDMEEYKANFQNRPNHLFQNCGQYDDKMWVFGNTIRFAQWTQANQFAGSHKDHHFCQQEQNRGNFFECGKLGWWSGDGTVDLPENRGTCDPNEVMEINAQSNFGLTCEVAHNVRLIGNVDYSAYDGLTIEEANATLGKNVGQRAMIEATQTDITIDCDGYSLDGARYDWYWDDTGFEICGDEPCCTGEGGTWLGTYCRFPDDGGFRAIDMYGGQVLDYETKVNLNKMVNGTIQNCEIFPTTAGLGGVDLRGDNLQIKDTNIYQVYWNSLWGCEETTGVTLQNLYLGGRVGMDCGGQNTDWVMENVAVDDRIAFNSRIDNLLIADSPYIDSIVFNQGGSNIELKNSVVGDVIRMNNYDYNSFFNISGNDIGRVEFYGGDNGQQFFTNNVVHEYIDDYSDYGAGEYITYYVDGETDCNELQGDYYGGDVWAGQCPPVDCMVSMETGCGFYCNDTVDPNFVIPAGTYYNVSDIKILQNGAGYSPSCTIDGSLATFVMDANAGNNERPLFINQNPNTHLDHITADGYVSFIREQEWATFIDDLKFTDGQPKNYPQYSCDVSDCIDFPDWFFQYPDQQNCEEDGGQWVDQVDPLPDYCYFDWACWQCGVADDQWQVYDYYTAGSLVLIDDAQNIDHLSLENSYIEGDTKLDLGEGSYWKQGFGLCPTSQGNVCLEYGDMTEERCNELAYLVEYNYPQFNEPEIFWNGTTCINDIDSSVQFAGQPFGNCNVCDNDFQYGWGFYTGCLDTFNPSGDPVYGWGGNNIYIANNVFNSTDSDLAVTHNSNEPNTWIFLILLDGVTIQNNTFYTNPNRPEPWMATPLRLSGVHNAQVSDNLFNGGGMLMSSVEWLIEETGGNVPACVNKDLTITGNEVHSANTRGNQFIGGQNVLIDDNQFYGDGNRQVDLFTANNWIFPNLPMENITFSNNLIDPTLTGDFYEIALLLSSRTANESGFFPTPVPNYVITGNTITTGKLWTQWNTYPPIKIYDNTIAGFYTNDEVGGVSGLDLCNGGIGNTYTGDFVLPMTDESRDISFDPACPELNIPDGILLITDYYDGVPRTINVDGNGVNLTVDGGDGIAVYGGWLSIYDNETYPNDVSPIQDAVISEINIFGYTGDAFRFDQYTYDNTYQNSLIEGSVATDLVDVDGDDNFVNINGACEEEWQVAYTECDVNDTMVMYYIDNNACGTFDFLPPDNSTIVPCDYCTPDWEQFDTGCLPDNTQMIYYEDLNDCGEFETLPPDNGTISACDFCEPEVEYVEGECIDFYERDEYVMTNYAECCAETGLIEDCELPPNPPPVACVGEHESDDIAGVVIDTAVETGKEYIGYAGVIATIGAGTWLLFLI